MGVQGGMTQMRFQPRQGRLLAAAAENVVSIFDVDSETCVHTLQVCGLCVNEGCGSLEDRRRVY